MKKDMKNTKSRNLQELDTFRRVCGISKSSNSCVISHRFPLTASREINIFGSSTLNGFSGVLV